jgi:NAD dependent epimerase/dehydratase family enzyme
MILFCVENQGIAGPVNGTAPWPVRNSDFTRALAAVLNRPALFHVPAFALRFLGEFSDELLGSKRVLPGVATAHGFPFEFPELRDALKALA